MSQDNVDVVLSTFRFANEGNLEAVVELYGEDAVLYAPEGWPEPGPWNGRGAILGQFRRLWEDFGEGKVLVDEVEAEGEWVIVEHVSRVHGPWAARGAIFTPPSRLACATGWWSRPATTGLATRRAGRSA